MSLTGESIPLSAIMYALLPNIVWSEKQKAED